METMDKKPYKIVKDPSIPTAQQLMKMMELRQREINLRLRTNRILYLLVRYARILFS